MPEKSTFVSTVRSVQLVASLDMSTFPLIPATTNVPAPYATPLKFRRVGVDAKLQVFPSAELRIVPSHPAIAYRVPLQAMRSSGAPVTAGVRVQLVPSGDVRISPLP